MTCKSVASLRTVRISYDKQLSSVGEFREPASSTGTELERIRAIQRDLREGPHEHSDHKCVLSAAS